MRGRALLSVFALVLLTGCGDKMIALTYNPGPSASPLPGAGPVTVFSFRDARGDEGDGNPYRVGGSYGGGGVLTSVDDLQRIMNDALSQFVQRVVTDPDITAQLIGGKRPE